MNGTEKLHELLQELTAQRTRLDARSRSLEEKAQQAAAGSVERMLLEGQAESIRELVETGIEFTHALAEGVIQVVEEIADAVGDPDGELVGIEPEHYEVIMGPLVEHRDMLDALIEQVQGDAEKAALKKKRAGTVAAIELVDELVLDPDDGEGGEDDGDEEAPESGTGSATEH